MSDTSQGPGWWLASDGKWYPPADTDAAPAPGWWLASDGKWYPPADAAPAPGWWLASDGTWYPPTTTDAPSGPDAPTTAAATAPRTDAPAPPTPVAPKAVKPTPVKPKAVKPTPVKPKAVKPTPVKPKAVKPTPVKPTPVAKAGDAGTTPSATPAAAAPAAKPPATPKPAAATPAKPAAAKPAATAPAAKPAAAKPAAAKPAAAPAAKPAATTPAPATPPAPPAAPRRPAAGLTSQTQIYVQNQASRADAQVLAQARSAAALRALKSLGAEVDAEEPTLRASRAARDLDVSTGTPTATPPAQPSPSPAPRPAAAPSPAAATPTPAAAPEADNAAPTSEEAAPTPAEAEPAGAGPPPLLEVKPSPLNTDVSHVGDRLVIFNDRVEMHDRNDRVRQVIRGEDITDVVVHRKFTGASVTVESISGEVMVAKGLRPDQAEEVRSVIQRRTRQGRPDGEAAARPSTPAAPAPEGERLTSTVRPATLDKDDLLAKLDDLHAAGILTDRELAAKRALVQRLATPLASSPR